MNLRWFKLYRAYSISFNSANNGKFFRSWLLKDCIEVQEKKENCCLLFMSSTKREIRTFHVVIVQRRQRNVQKRVMHVNCCCFANLNLLLFCRSRSRRRRRCLSSLISYSPTPLPHLAPVTQATRSAWKYSASTLPTAKTFGCWSIEGLTFIPINHWYLFIHIWAEVERVNLERSILSSEITRLLESAFC